MIKEGVLKQNILKNGTYYDHVHYGISASDLTF